MPTDPTATALPVAEIDEREFAAIREETRRFADGRIRPLAAELDETERFPAELYAEWRHSASSASRSRRRTAGVGADVLTYAAVMEEFARGYASVADQCGLVELVATLLSQHGSELQRDAYLGPLLAGTRCCAYALTEADAGSGPPDCARHGVAGRRRLAPHRRKAVDPQRAGRRFRPGARAHRPGGGTTAGWASSSST